MPWAPGFPGCSSSKSRSRHLTLAGAGPSQMTRICPASTLGIHPAHAEMVLTITIPLPLDAVFQDDCKAVSWLATDTRIQDTKCCEVVPAPRLRAACELPCAGHPPRAWAAAAESARQSRCVGAATRCRCARLSGTTAVHDRATLSWLLADRCRLQEHTSEPFSAQLLLLTLQTRNRATCQTKSNKRHTLGCRASMNRQHQPNAGLTHARACTRSAREVAPSARAPPARACRVSDTSNGTKSSSSAPFPPPASQPSPCVASSS